AALALAAAFGTAPAAGLDDVKLETKKLEGTWRLISFEENGTKLSEEELKGVRLTMKGNTFKATLADSPEHWEGTYKVVEVKGKVRWSDVTYTKTSTEGLRGKTLPQLAEWLDDDTFRVCIPTSDDKDPPRPTEFNGKRDSGQAVLVFRRVKE